MALSFACSCTQHLEIDDEYAGQDVQCPSCGTIVTAPLKRARVIAAPRSENPKHTSTAPDFDDDQSDDDAPRRRLQRRLEKSTASKSRVKKRKSKGLVGEPNWGVVAMGVFGMLMMGGITVKMLLEDKLHCGVLLGFVLCGVAAIGGALGFSDDD